MISYRPNLNWHSRDWHPTKVLLACWEDRSARSSMKVRREKPCSAAAAASIRLNEFLYYLVSEKRCESFGLSKSYPTFVLAYSAQQTCLFEHSSSQLVKQTSRCWFLSGTQSYERKVDSVFTLVQTFRAQLENWPQWETLQTLWETSDNCMLYLCWHLLQLEKKCNYFAAKS